MNTTRPSVYVGAEFTSDDPVRTFYEIPDDLAERVHAANAVDGEDFAGCLHNLVLEWEAARVEIKRLSRESKAKRQAAIKDASATVRSRRSPFTSRGCEALGLSDLHDIERWDPMQGGTPPDPLNPDETGPPDD